jgi:DNA-binding transcriptional regulator YiaG
MAATNPVTVKVRERAKKLQKDEGVSPLIAEACAGIDELVAATATGESHEGLYTIRTRKLELKPREYGPDEVRAVRIKLKASQALLARFMGVNTQTVSYWEQGRRKVPPMARRYLDDLVDFPVLWTSRTGSSLKLK